MHAPRTHYYLNFLVSDPDEIVSIRWYVDGCGGSTECKARNLVHEINALEAAGYVVVDVSKL